MSLYHWASPRVTILKGLEISSPEEINLVGNTCIVALNTMEKTQDINVMEILIRIIELEDM